MWCHCMDWKCPGVVGHGRFIIRTWFGMTGAGGGGKSGKFESVGGVINSGFGAGAGTSWTLKYFDENMMNWDSTRT